MTLTFTEELTVNVGGPYSICEDGTTIDLIGTVINGNGLDGVLQLMVFSKIQVAVPRLLGIPHMSLVLMIMQTDLSL